LPRYIAAYNKTDKSFVVSQVLHEIRHWSSERLGFVTLDAKTGRWISLKDSLARVSVGQAFRDSLTGKYRSSGFSKQQKRLVEQVEANRSMCRLVSSSGSTTDADTVVSSSATQDKNKEKEVKVTKLPTRKVSEIRKKLNSVPTKQPEAELKAQAPEHHRMVVHACETTHEDSFPKKAPPKSASSIRSVVQGPAQEEKELEMAWFPDIAFTPMLQEEAQGDLWTAADLTSVFEDDDETRVLFSDPCQAPAAACQFQHQHACSSKTFEQGGDDEDLDFLLSMPLFGPTVEHIPPQLPSHSTVSTVNMDDEQKDCRTELNGIEQALQGRNTHCTLQRFPILDSCHARIDTDTILRAPPHSVQSSVHMLKVVKTCSKIFADGNCKANCAD